MTNSGTPIPTNRNVLAQNPGSPAPHRLHRLPTGGNRPGQPKPQLGPIGWIVLAPFLLAALFILFALIVSLGASIESAMVGG